MQGTKTITPAEALIWLASLEKECPCHECHGNPVIDTYLCQGRQLCCAGTSKVPVLDLREPCPCYSLKNDCWQCDKERRHSDTFEDHALRLIHSQSCINCQGRNWLPKQGRDALFAAMHKAGWKYEIFQGEHLRLVTFFKGVNVLQAIVRGQHSDDGQAAVKAMKAAGYSV